MRILITGGAGYIGSHTVLALSAAGHEVVIVDDFRNSSPLVVPRLQQISGVDFPVHEMDLGDRAATAALFATEPVDAVIHFAGDKSVGESVANPLQYYRNNLSSTINVVENMQKTGVEHLVFSSSATVYHPDCQPPLIEDMPVQASNPYGWTKVMSEQILRDAAAAGGMKVALLRYFNPVGAHPSGLIGEQPHGIPNNLMPFITQTLVGQRKELVVFGDDYPTADGTCIRDYIHVLDLAAGHVSALDALPNLEAGVARAWNLGTGAGVSVLEAIAAMEQASGQKVPYSLGPRRAGDLPFSWANVQRAERELGWSTQYSLAQACQDSWRWQQQNPHGYDSAGK